MNFKYVVFSGATRISSSGELKSLNNTSQVQWKNPQNLVSIGISRFFPQEMGGQCCF